MIVTIEREICVSCGNCWDSCPDFFEQNPDDSFSQILEGFRINKNNAEGTPPADQETCAWNAAELCPVGIIHIEA
ncbi:MAG: ferredoxin [Methanoregula sp.]|jgi:ferredoxin|nr:ferredoxin [Methanoregula sp.]